MDSIDDTEHVDDTRTLHINFRQKYYIYVCDVVFRHNNYKKVKMKICYIEILSALVSEQDFYFLYMYD